MSPSVEKLISALTGHDCDPRQSGGSWSARCPAHEDRRPSLPISDGDNGRALVRCHAGCSVESICDAVGLRVSDLMPDNGVDVDTTPRRPRKQSVSSTPKASKTYQTANAAIAALERKHGKRSARWIYHDLQGDPVGVIARWDKAGGKEIRPVARRDDRWTIGGMPEPRPLYCLTDLTNANRVYITEGEKAADAARSIGLVATTSAHGSQSPDKTDWTPLAGKECIVLPDNDLAGEKYANAVAAILTKLTPPAVVKVVQLPGLPEHGDIADWVNAL